MLANDTAAARQPNQDYPIAIATIPATAAQRRTAVAVIIVLVIVAALVAPFANTQLARVDAFVPVLQTVLAVADLITAVLLFSQYLILPKRALLAVGCAYLCSASFAFLQTLSFPGAYSPAGLIGDGFNSPAWFFVLWHMTFPLGILIYALLKDEEAPIGQPGRPAEASIGLTILAVLIVIVALVWLVTAGVGKLPAFYTDDVIRQTNLGNRVNVGLLLWYGIVLAVLLSRRHTILDVWLIVVLAAWMPNFAVAALASSARFSLGWYAARCFALIASFMLLSLLLTEMTVLYSRLANAFSLLRRERANRLMSVDAATAAIAHEVRTPLAAISLNASSALAQLRSKPPILEEVDAILGDIEADSLRANQVIAGVRALFKEAADHRTVVRVEDVVRQALSLAEPELQASQVAALTEFQDSLAYISVDAAQLQQVILNLIRNGIDATSSSAPEMRRLRLTTKVREGSAVLISIQDSGPGIPAGDRERIFDAFFTTKTSGMGLGLAISRTIMENHGGSLRLCQSGSNGSIFEIAVPISSVKSGREPATIADADQRRAN
ncbi:sensor histidine kinase [Bradyrhizobium macuxiense]|uniref:sensor histidine kinase n=1 Tax=Bradyrhizobium macuxiense TaxID=1755647 RepID=UPI000833FDFD|nr:MASE4 domain-containing protein [Bradyrhizobium macuxiense]